MEDKKKKIKELKDKLNKLNPIVEKRFKTSKELEAYIQKNKHAYEEANDLWEQIEKLEFELMTPEEQKAEQELLEKMKLKRDGKL